MHRTKITWRIQLALSDNPGSRALFHLALAGHQVSAARLLPRGTDGAEMTGEVLVDLTQGGGLGDLLEALHALSPRVFVTCADLAPASTRTPENSAQHQLS
jgi:hypothetical protein